MKKIKLFQINYIYVWKYVSSDYNAKFLYKGTLVYKTICCKTRRKTWRKCYTCSKWNQIAYLRISWKSIWYIQYVYMHDHAYFGYHRHGALVMCLQYFWNRASLFTKCLAIRIFIHFYCFPNKIFHDNLKFLL